MSRYLKPAMEEVGAPWGGFHTLRHTCASILFANGRNIRQVQHWLGHHSPSFTLDTYVHLLDDGIGEGLDLPRTSTPRLASAAEKQRLPPPIGGWRPRPENQAIS